MNKAQIRKQKRKEETELLNSKRKLIADAEAMDDLLVDIPIFKKFDRNGISATVASYNECPEEYKEWVFELTTRHMKPFYEASWGWSDNNKRTELFEEHSRYLIALQNETNRPIGFIHIRFEMQGKETTCYVYELHIEDEFQRHGLGRFLMQAAEFVALKRKMESVMLTVFVDNVASRQFYKKMNYQLHPSTPILADRENSAEYSDEILFKPLVKKAPASQ